MNRTSNEPSYKDPVCGMEVSRMAAIDEFAYQGKTYYFCATSCKESFQENPQQYVRQHRQHGLKQKNDGTDRL